MKRKSILIIGNYPPPFGGVPRHIEYLVPCLVEKGWDVHILSAGQSGIESKNNFTIYKPSRKLKIYSFINFLLKHKRSNIFKYKSIIKDSLRNWLRYMAYISVGRQIIEKNHVKIISAYNLSRYAPVGAVLSEKYGIPLVVTNFGEIYDMGDFLKRNLDMVKYICSKTTKLLSMSRHCAESYKILGFSPHVEVIPYGINVRKFSPLNNGSKIRQKIGINSEDNVVLFVGRMIKDMGLHTLMECIPQVLRVNDKIRFIIVGERGELFPQALQLSRSYRKHVFVIPAVPLEELPLYYAASTLVVVPTQGDRACGSLTAIEAMSTGKPVIASKIGGIPEIVVDGETGVQIPPEDYSTLAEVILNLLNDEPLMKKMGTCGRVRVEAKWDKDKTNRRIEHIFSELVEV